MKADTFFPLPFRDNNIFFFGKVSSVFSRILSIQINLTTINPELLLTTLKEKMLEETCLQTKTQKKIQLLDYLPPTRDNKKVAFFIFPREEDGKPLLTLEDKEVAFFIQLGNLNLKCKFKLKDMVVNGKLEL